jgi:NADPH:quinone reductase-like Zn-dependent oxidoreductase
MIASTNTILEALASSPLATIVLMVLAFPTAFWIVAYLTPQIYMMVRPVPNLKQRYRAEWALVTGGGSGIGRSLAFKLASQGLNVVLVSLDDGFLKSTVADLSKTYPTQQFRAVPTNFAPGVDYMAKIRAATKDVHVPIVFSNAGFLLTGTAESLIECAGRCAR